MTHLAMLVMFHVNVITCQNFNLPNMYRIFARKKYFLKWKFQINHIIHGSNYMKWYGSIYLQLS